jgi:hypothetical protein
MNQLIKSVVVLLSVLLIVSCAGNSTKGPAKEPAKATEKERTTEDGRPIVPYKTLLSRNIVNMNKISIGMTKSEVMAVMGDFISETPNSLVPNPYMTEPFSILKTQYEVLYYLTQPYIPFTAIKLSQATPVILKNGHVVGWGDDSLAKAKKGEYQD